MSEKQYRISVPGRLYDALRNRDAFTADNDSDRAALAAFEAAERVKVGSGWRYDITGDREVLESVLDYIHSLAELVRAGMAPASEFGVSLKRLTEVHEQEPR